jgi:hypothetical protein
MITKVTGPMASPTLPKAKATKKLGKKPNKGKK